MTFIPLHEQSLLTRLRAMEQRIKVLERQANGRMRDARYRDKIWRAWVDGTLDADLDAGSTATVDSGAWTVSDDWLETGKKLASGTKVIAFWKNGAYWVRAADTCAVDQ